MIDEVSRAFNAFYAQLNGLGWSTCSHRISKQARSVYLVLRRTDGLSVPVRISDHPSRRFKTGPRRFSIIAHDPGTLDHALRWFRSHAPGELS